MKGVANNPEERRRKFAESRRKKQLDRIGEKFGRLTIIDIEYNNRRNLCVCQCECGNIHKVPYYELANGKVLSCGCLHSELLSKKYAGKISKNKYGYNWYFMYEGQKVYCESSYEVILANYFMDNNIDFEYHTKTFVIENNKRYTPDFYIRNKDMYIEVKGSYWDDIHEDKLYNDIRDIYGINIELYTWDILKDIAKIPYSQSGGIIRAAKKSDIPVEEYVSNRMYLKQLSRNR